MMIVNEASQVHSFLPSNAQQFEAAEVINGASQLCVLPMMIPLPPFHGLPMGQSFTADIGADSFATAIDSMATDLADDIGFICHPWLCHWLDLVKANPMHFCMQWVSQADIHDSIANPAEPPSVAIPLSMPLFSLDYGLAYSLHRDCIVRRIRQTHYLEAFFAL
jgi:hypothetical protein